MPFTLPNLKAAIAQYDRFKKNSPGPESATIGRLRNLARELSGGQVGLIQLVNPVFDSEDITEQVLGSIYPLVMAKDRMQQFVNDYDSSKGGILNPVRRGTNVNLVLGDLYMSVQALLMPARLGSTTTPQRARSIPGDVRRPATSTTGLLSGTRSAEAVSDADISTRDQVALVGAACCIWCCGTKEMKEQLRADIEAAAQREAAKATTSGVVSGAKKLGL